MTKQMPTPSMLGAILDNGDGTVRSPRCCGGKMTDAGGCSTGCCDYYRCALCGKRLVVEWPD